MQQFFQLTAIRIFKLLGNLLKVIFYLHIQLFPKARFQVPPSAAPLWQGSSKRIPAVLWLTNYTDQVTLAVYVNYLWNRLMAPTCAVKYCLDPECEAFVETHFPGRFETAYKRLQIGAAKADFWRVLALYKHGGFYVDMDAALSWPLQRQLKANPAEILPRYPDGRLTNYFLAFEPGHPLLLEIAERICSNIESNTIKSVYDMTGPTIFEQLADRECFNIVSTRLLARQGMLTSKKLQYPGDIKRYWVEAEKDTPIAK